MPPVSKAQNRFMQACKSEPGKMQGKCPPADVVAEFTQHGIHVKDLPERAARPHSSPPSTDGELAQGYRFIGKCDY